MTSDGLLSEIQSPKQCNFLQRLLLVLIALGGGDLIAELVVLSGQALTLLLEGLNIAVLGLKLLSQSANLANGAGLCETSGVLAASLLVTLEELDTVLKTEDIENHSVSAVEDQREEQGEATQVHVALGVELAGLNLHAVSAEVGSSAVEISN
jgi:hypothetical protein